MNPQQCPPVLVLAFNRPDTTAAVIESLRPVQPGQVFFAVDGARLGRPEEAQRVSEVHKLANRIDWTCQVQTLFRDSNLGCKRAVSEAISWFFEHVEAGIVMEDDCIAHPSFFPFAAELLARFEHDARVMMISGDNFQFGRRGTDASYYFSRHTHIWGWATWRRAWERFDFEMRQWPELRRSGWLEGIVGERKHVRYWERIFDETHGNRNASWAYRWTYSVWLNHGLAILPNANLVSNIGFGDHATHTRRSKNPLAAMAVEEMRFPLAHPPAMNRDEDADAFTERTVFNPGTIVRRAARDLYRRLRGAE